MTAKKFKNTAMIKRLKAHMEKSRINARELAERANLGSSFIYDILNGKSTNPTTHKLSSVAEVLGLSVPYLMHGVSEKRIEKFSVREKFDELEDIVGLCVEERNGKRVIVDSHVMSDLCFCKGWVKERLGAVVADLRIVKIYGDGMYPTLMDGDTVLINLTLKALTPPGIFMLFDGVGLVAKRLEYIPDSAAVRVIFDNPKYASRDVDIDEIQVIGRVVWFGRRL